MGTQFLEWLSSNAVATYPFKEESTLQDDSDSVRIPKDLFLDFAAIGPPADRRYFVGQIRVSSVGGFQSLEIDLITEILAVVATISVTTNPGLVRTVDSVNGIDAGRVIYFKWVWGPAVAGNIFPVIHSAFPYTFTGLQAEFEPSTVAPAALNVLSVSILDPDEPVPIAPLTIPTQLFLEGNVLIEEGNNISVSVDAVDNSVILSAARGLGLGIVTECLEEEELDPRPLARINGQDSETDGDILPYTGDFRLLGDECIRVIPYPQENTIGIWNACRPCCECEKLEELLEALEGVERVFGIFKFRPENIELADYFSIAVGLLELSPDSISLADTFTITRNPGVHDSITLTDVLHLNFIRENFRDTVSLTDTVTVTVPHLRSVDSVSLSDTLHLDIQYQDFHDPIQLEDSGTVASRSPVGVTQFRYIT